MGSFNRHFVFLVVLFCVATHQIYGFEYADKHNEIKQNPNFYAIKEGMSSLQKGRALDSESYPNFRIYAYFDYLEGSTPKSYAAYIRDELVPPVVDYFQAALKIKYPVSGNLVLDSNVSTICGHDVPSILKSEGVPADFFIYYDSETNDNTQIANSNYCYLSISNRRPLIARTIINRNTLPIANGNVLLHEKNMYVIMHEMIHTLGFSATMYEYFIDNNGNPLSGHIKSALIAGHTRTIIDVPPLTEKLRNFFGCSSLEGAIMENNGGSGSASHFERKYFLYEVMSSGSIAGRRVSEFSLAMLEGSGWYVPNYEYAEPYSFGQGQGCSFLADKCSGGAPHFDEFCNGDTRRCAASGRGGGYCSSDSIMDGCKYIYPHEDYDCENPDGQDFARLPNLQIYGRGTGSKCFTGDLNTRESSNGHTSFCFRYTCSGSGSSSEVEIQVGSNKITCTKAEKKTIDGYYGSIDCPDPLTFCNTVGKKYCPRNCMGRGNCVNNQCECHLGYSGVDCALKG